MLEKVIKKYKEECSLILITVIIYMVYMVISKIYPFGENSLIAGDVAGQYYEFWAYMKNVLLGKESAMYSFSKSIGGSMIGVWAYYLLSPFNIIFLFFNENKFADLLVIITELKITTCSITFYKFVKNKSDNNFLNIILSLAYAFCGFTVAYQMNIMWLDGICFLPIVCLGIEKIIQNRSLNLYIIALSLSIITNFYVGFSICIFASIYYIYTYIVNYKKTEVKKVIIDLIVFFICNIISLMISCIIIIPVYYMLANGKGSGLVLNIEYFKETNFKYIEILGKILPGAINNKQIFYGLPNIYSGILIIFLVEIFFLNKKVTIKEKIASLILILLLLFMMHNKLINLIWHGLKEPTGFPYRYSFIFSFILIMIASRGQKNIKKISIKSIISISIINLFIMIFILTRKYDYIENNSLYLSIIFMIIYEIVYMLYLKQEKSIFIILIGVVFCLELIYNYTETYKNSEHLERTSYVNTVEEYLKIFKEVKNNDNSFYRMEKKTNFYLNDSLLFNYYGVGHSSSTFDSNATNLLKKIGYNWYIDWPSYGTGNTLLTDMLFGIKYKLSKNNVEEHFEAVKDIYNYKLLENKKYLSIGYTTKGYIKQIEDDDNDPFELQQSFLNQLTIEDNTYFNSIKEKDIKFIEVEDLTESNYKKINDNSHIELEYDLENIDNQNLYFYIKSTYYSDNPALKIYLNDKYYDLYLGSNKMGIININRTEWNIQDKLNIKVYFNTDDNVNITQFILNVINYEQLEQAYTVLSQNELENVNYKNNKLIGQIDVQEENMYFSTTILYEDEWKIYIDGVETPKQEDAEFLVVKIEPGYHKIELRYETSGLKIGKLISLIGMVILVLGNVYNYSHFKEGYNYH